LTKSKISNRKKKLFRKKFRQKETFHAKRVSTEKKVLSKIEKSLDKKKL